MELYLDTSDVAAVKALARVFPLAGVTTNPSIVAAGKQTLEVLLPQLQEAMGGQGRLFAQVMATTAEGMVSDARKLRAIIADIVVKVPVTAEGLTAIKLLKEEGIPTLGTAVYGAAQGLFAALAGAEYVAPYVNRVDAQGRRHSDGERSAGLIENACPTRQSPGSQFQNTASGAGLPAGGLRVHHAAAGCRSADD